MINDTFTGANLCDSIHTTNLTINNAVYTSIFDTICQYDSSLFAGNYYSTTGVYYDTLSAAAANGCDSIVALNLLVEQNCIEGPRWLCDGTLILSQFPNLTTGPTGYRDVNYNGVTVTAPIITGSIPPINGIGYNRKDNLLLRLPGRYKQYHSYIQ